MKTAQEIRRIAMENFAINNKIEINKIFKQLVLSAELGNFECTLNEYLSIDLEKYFLYLGYGIKDYMIITW